MVGRQLTVTAVPATTTGFLLLLFVVAATIAQGQETLLHTGVAPMAVGQHHMAVHIPSNTLWVSATNGTLLVYELDRQSTSSSSQPLRLLWSYPIQSFHVQFVSVTAFVSCGLEGVLVMNVTDIRNVQSVARLLHGGYALCSTTPHWWLVQPSANNNAREPGTVSDRLFVFAQKGGEEGCGGGQKKKNTDSSNTKEDLILLFNYREAKLDWGLVSPFTMTLPAPGCDFLFYGSQYIVMHPPRQSLVVLCNKTVTRSAKADDLDADLDVSDLAFRVGRPASTTAAALDPVDHRLFVAEGNPSRLSAHSTAGVVVELSALTIPTTGTGSTEEITDFSYEVKRKFLFSITGNKLYAVNASASLSISSSLSLGTAVTGCSQCVVQDKTIWIRCDDGIHRVSTNLWLSPRVPAIIQMSDATMQRNVLGAYDVATDPETGRFWVLQNGKGVISYYNRSIAGADSMIMLDTDTGRQLAFDKASEKMFIVTEGHGVFSYSTDPSKPRQVNADVFLASPFPTGSPCRAQALNGHLFVYFRTSTASTTCDAVAMYDTATGLLVASASGLPNIPDIKMIGQKQLAFISAVGQFVVYAVNATTKQFVVQQVYIPRNAPTAFGVLFSPDGLTTRRIFLSTSAGVEVLEAATTSDTKTIASLSFVAQWNDRWWKSQSPAGLLIDSTTEVAFCRLHLVLLSDTIHLTNTFAVDLSNGALIDSKNVYLDVEGSYALGNSIFVTRDQANTLATPVPLVTLIPVPANPVYNVCPTLSVPFHFMEKGCTGCEFALSECLDASRYSTQYHRIEKCLRDRTNCVRSRCNTSALREAIAAADASVTQGLLLESETAVYQSCLRMACNLALSINRTYLMTQYRSHEVCPFTHQVIVYLALRDHSISAADGFPPYSRILVDVENYLNLTVSASADEEHAVSCRTLVDNSVVCTFGFVVLGVSQEYPPFKKKMADLNTTSDLSQWASFAGAHVSVVQLHTEKYIPPSSETRNFDVNDVDGAVYILAGTLGTVGILLIIALVSVILVLRARARSKRHRHDPEHDLLPINASAEDLKQAELFMELDSAINHGAPEVTVIQLAHKLRVYAATYVPERPEGPLVALLKELCQPQVTMLHMRTKREIALAAAVFAVHTASKCVSKNIPLEASTKSAWEETATKLRNRNSVQHHREGFHTNGLDFALDVIEESMRCTGTYLGGSIKSDVARTLAAASAAFAGHVYPLLELMVESVQLNRDVSEGWFPQVVRYTAARPDDAFQRTLVKNLLRDAPVGNWHAIYQWLLLTDSILTFCDDSELHTIAIETIKAQKWTEHLNWRVREKVADTVSHLATVVDPTGPTALLAAQLFTELRLTETDPRVQWTISQSAKESELRRVLKTQILNVYNTVERQVSAKQVNYVAITGGATGDNETAEAESKQNPPAPGAFGGAAAGDLNDFEFTLHDLDLDIEGNLEVRKEALDDLARVQTRAQQVLGGSGASSSAEPVALVEIDWLVESSKRETSSGSQPRHKQQSSSSGAGAADTPANPMAASGNSDKPATGAIPAPGTWAADYHRSLEEQKARERKLVDFRSRSLIPTIGGSCTLDAHCCEKIRQMYGAIQNLAAPRADLVVPNCLIFLATDLEEPTATAVELYEACRQRRRFNALSDLLVALQVVDALFMIDTDVELTLLQPERRTHDIRERLARCFSDLGVHFGVSAYSLPSASVTEPLSIRVQDISFDNKSEGISATLLGSGAFGTVMKGRYLGREVAVKMVRTTSTSMAQRTVDEASLHTRLFHPNIVAVYGLAREDNHVHLVMELCSGGPLSELLFDTTKKLTLSKKISMTQQIAHAMHYLHSGGIDPITKELVKVLHGDLKPANVLLDADGNIKLTDFGHAALRHTSFSHGLSHSPEAGRRGTMGYQSPEAFHGQALSTRSDVFSFGIVIYEIWTRRKAFEREPEVQEALKSGNMPSLEDIGVTTIKNVIAKCWEKDSSSRPMFADIVAVLDSLDE